ncbi:MAG: type IX secretion system membrane protein PorP/SprF [Elusimicrobia bacterium]|nr:type IX secretion system membrane protein PorP/SprF [Elusimicrobiota bacterium]
MWNIEYRTKKVLFSLIFLHSTFNIQHSTPLWGAFEESLPGARPSAMAGVFTAISDDANAVFSNPAGLGWIEHQEFASGYSRLYHGLWDGSNLGTGFLGFTRPLYYRRRHMGTLGLGWLNFSLVQFYSEDTLALSYGKELLPEFVPGLYGGLAAKFLQHAYKLDSDPTASANPFFKTYGTKASALDLDAGLLYRRLQNWSFAYRVGHLNRPDVGLRDRDIVPMFHEIGLAHHRPAAIFAVELFKQEQEQSLKAGAEKRLLDGQLAARAGFIFGNRDLRQITLGFGLQTKSFSLDYSFNFPLTGIESTNGTYRVSFTGPVGERPKKPLAQGAERLLPEEEAVLTDELGRARRDLRQYRRRIKELEKALGSGLPNKDLTPGPSLDADNELSEVKKQLEEIKTILDKTRQDAKAAKERELTLKALKEKEAAEAKKPKAGTQARFHNVRPGDTLRSLALEYYGQEDLWLEIFKANEKSLKRGGETEPGQTLIIPAMKKE